MAVEEDFSFPATLDPLTRCGIDSPPLWRLSPAASPISCRRRTAKDQYRRDRTADDGGGGGGVENDRFASVNNYYLAEFTASARRRFSSDMEMAKVVVAAGDDVYEEDAAEKMDVLWENFNEELSRSRRSRLIKSAESMEEIVKARLGCVTELNLSETSGAVATTRKSGKTVIVKALKKLFLLHNISRRKLQPRSR